MDTTTKLLQRAQRDHRIASILGSGGLNCGPFDGGCLIVARALIKAAGRGQLARLDSQHGPEHFGAFIDGRFMDLSGAYESGNAWAAAIARQELIGDRLLVVRLGFAQSEFPDPPAVSNEIAVRLRQIGLSFVSSESATPTDAPDFRCWFGDSKIVDEHGRPMVVYHGRFNDFDAFNLGYQKATEYGAGFYFTACPEAAARHAEGPGGNIVPVYLRLQHPLVVQGAFADGDLWRAAGATKRSEITPKLRNKGYDGVIRMQGGAMKEIVAFASSQIKSAVGNSGRFDPQSDSLTDSGPAPGFYHGTNATFDRFDLSTVGANLRSSRGGFFFSDDRQVAEAYAADVSDEHGGAPRVLRAQLELRRPLIVAARENPDRYFDRHSVALLKQAEESNYDSIVVHGRAPDNTPQKMALVFSPDQIQIADHDPPQLFTTDGDLSFPGM